MKVILDNSEPGTDMMKHINVLKSMGFGITRPNINASDRYSSIMDKFIVLGFDSIKSVTPTDIDLILKNGPYQSFEHFLEVSGVKNKAKIESLIFSGCFELWEDEEATFNKFHKGRLPVKKQPNYEHVKLTFTELKRREYDSISTNVKYLINDTIREMKQILASGDSKYIDTMLPSEIKQKLGARKGFYTIGILGSYIAKRSKSSGKPMGVATLMDDNGSVDFFIWQNKMKVFEEVNPGELLVLSLGRFSDSETMFLNRIIEKFGNEEVTDNS